MKLFVSAARVGSIFPQTKPAQLIAHPVNSRTSIENVKHANRPADNVLRSLSVSAVGLLAIWTEPSASISAHREST